MHSRTACGSKDITRLGLHRWQPSNIIDKHIRFNDTYILLFTIFIKITYIVRLRIILYDFLSSNGNFL